MSESIKDQRNDEPARLTVEVRTQRSRLGLVPRSAALGSRTPIGASRGRVD